MEIIVCARTREQGSRRRSRQNYDQKSYGNVRKMDSISYNNKAASREEQSDV